jgi:ribosome-associated protein
MGQMTDQQFAVELARLASDMKCGDVVIMDLRGLSSVADFFVIGSGTSDRQMRAVSDELDIYGKKVGERAYRISGHEAATWILIDFVNVVVHLFTPQARLYYDLELMWGDAPRVDWVKSASA